MTTASLVQVRQPLFTGSVGRSRLYGDGLKPLTDALGNNPRSPSKADTERTFTIARKLQRRAEHADAETLFGVVLAAQPDLSADDEGRMPARDLCNALGWEKSRVSHQMRRMEADGLIGREANPDDARSTMVRLLPAGRAAIEKAAPRHVQDVRRNFIDLLTPAELETLTTLNERVLHHLGERGEGPVENM